MLSYDKSSSNIEYFEQNMKYKTHKIYTQNLTPHSQYVTIANSQVTNKLNTEPNKQKDQTFIITAFLIYASFATKRMRVDFCLDAHCTR